MHLLLRKRTYLFFSLLFVAVLAGCGSGNNNNSASTTYQGTIAGTGGVTGTLTVNVQSVVATSSGFSFIRSAEAQSTGDIPATGNCILANGGGTIALNGTFNTGTSAINLSGSGYNFTGTIPSGSGQMSGTFTGPGGVTGGFSAVSTSNNVTANSFCGRYNGGSTSDVGTFNVTIDPVNGTLDGNAAPDSGTSGTATSLTATAVSANTYNGCTSDCSPFCAVVQGSVINGSFFSNGGSLEGCFSGNQATGNPPECSNSGASCDPTQALVCNVPTACNGIPAGCP